MSTQMYTPVVHGMPKKLAEAGWELLTNGSEPAKYRARNGEVEIGPYPSMEAAQDAAWAATENGSVEEQEDSAGTAEGQPRHANGERVDLFVFDIRTDGGTQPRALFQDEVVEEYKEAMLHEAEFPRIDVFWDDTNYWLADGFYRTEATKRTGFKNIAATVHLGTQRDAILFSAGANETHGQRRTNADKRRAIISLLMDAEWTQWSDGKIASVARVSQTFVGNIRKELITQNVLSDQSVRRTTDGRVVDTSKIGRKTEEQSEAAEREEGAANPELFSTGSRPSKAPTVATVDKACRDGFFVFIGNRQGIAGASTYYGATPAAKGNVWVSVLPDYEWREVKASDVVITSERSKKDDDEAANESVDIAGSAPGSAAAVVDRVQEDVYARDMQLREKRHEVRAGSGKSESQLRERMMRLSFERLTDAVRKKGLIDNALRVVCCEVLNVGTDLRAIAERHGFLNQITTRVSLKTLGKLRRSALELVFVEANVLLEGWEWPLSETQREMLLAYGIDVAKLEREAVAQLENEEKKFGAHLKTLTGKTNKPTTRKKSTKAKASEKSKAQTRSSLAGKKKAAKPKRIAKSKMTAKPKKATKSKVRSR